MAKERTPAPGPATVDAVPSASGTALRSERKPLQWAQWFRVTVIVLFGLLYVWDLFEAVSNLFGKLAELASVNEVRALNGFAPIDTPWAFMIVNLLLPVVVFALAVVIARKRNVGILAMVLLAGLGVVGAISLSLTAFVLQMT
ncbi:MAG: hypothetical protein ABIW32_02605 [Terrimesophilobacter sp.]